MYHYAALGIKFKYSLRRQRILDIGCGRGGGLAFLTNYYEPEIAVGIDNTSY